MKFSSRVLVLFLSKLEMNLIPCLPKYLSIKEEEQMTLIDLALQRKTNKVSSIVFLSWYISFVTLIYRVCMVITNILLKMNQRGR